MEEYEGNHEFTGDQTPGFGVEGFAHGTEHGQGNQTQHRLLIYSHSPMLSPTLRQLKSPSRKT